MKEAKEKYKAMVDSVPADIKLEIDLSFRISNRIAELMQARSLTCRQLAEALGKRPSEVTKWLSGQYNFSIATIAALSAFFDETIISVA
jgi:antitoxin component HigA of HigAB toxin-antitoxin module